MIEPGRTHHATRRILGVPPGPLRQKRRHHAVERVRVSQEEQVSARQPRFRARRVLTHGLVRGGQPALNELLIRQASRVWPAPVGEHRVRVALTREGARHRRVEPVCLLELVDRLRHAHRVSLGEVEAAAMALDAVVRALEGRRPKKVIVVPQRIVNVVV